MRVVVADPDGQFAALVADRLSEDGHEVACAGSPQQLDALLRVRPADVVLVDLSRRRMNGFDLARDLRKSHGPELKIVLVSPMDANGDPEVDVLANEVDAMSCLEKPLDLDMLSEELMKPRAAHASAPEPVRQPRKAASAPAPQPSASARPRVRPKVHWENARTLMQLWAVRATGQLVITGGARSGSVGLREGGLVDPTAVPLVEVALDGGVVAFQEGSVDGVGDWILLGNQVFVRCRSACEDNTLLGYMSATPVHRDATEMARALAITGPTRRLMGAMNGESNLANLLDRCDAIPSEVSSDIEALVQLGLLGLRRGDEVQEGPPVGNPDVEISGHESKVLKRARASADLDGLAGIEQDAIAGAYIRGTPAQRLARLDREMQTVEAAPPPVVLGVPADASSALVDEAASRMRDRYSRLARDPELSAPAHQLASQIGQIVDQAHRNFSFQVHTQTGSDDVAKGDVSSADRVVILLEQGRKFVARGEWSAADAVLTQAHRDQLDHPGVLSNLGWARLHNPDREEAERTEEGRDFLLLGEQFDQEHVDGQYFLAQYLLASDLLEAAAQRAQRAKEAAPNDPGRVALHRKIQILLAGEQD